jgi:hypothetical protein
MKPRLSIALLVVGVALAALGLFLSARAEGAVFDFTGAAGIVAGFTPFFVAGLLIYRRQPANRIGWLLLMAALGVYTYVVVVGYLGYVQTTAVGQAFPGQAASGFPAGFLAGFAAWYATWGWITYVWPVTSGLPLLFPTGRLHSPRWRPLFRFSVGYAILMSAFYAFYPGPVAGLEPLGNPLAIPALGRLPFTPQQMEDWYWPVPVLSVISLLVRFRQSEGEERAQIKWFLYAAILFLGWGTYGTLVSAGWLPAPGPHVSSTVFTLIVSAFGAAIAVAILKYRLYDIDIIIRRTLAYSLLTALLALLFLGGVIVLQRAFAGITAQESQPAIVLSTLAIAALFNPLRLRIQGWIDRRFYRRRYDAQRVLERLAQVTRDETDVDRLLGELAAVVEETVHPARISIWLAGAGSETQLDTRRETLP